MAVEAGFNPGDSSSKHSQHSLAMDRDLIDNPCLNSYGEKWGIHQAIAVGCD